MILRRICLLTDNVRKLYMFYRKVTQLNASHLSYEYVEFDLGEMSLAIYDVKAHNSLVDNKVTEVKNMSSMIEIEVNDVDVEYERLCKMNIKWAKHPTTQPWGTRSIYFYDPDGNLVNFYCVPNEKNN